MTPRRMNRNRIVRDSIVVLASLLVGCVAPLDVALADETCNSPYISKLIKGQEDYVYVWALGVEGLGDGSDKLVTVDVDPKSKSYGKVIHSVSVGSRGEAHHMGFTDDRRFIWAGGLAESQDLRVRHRDGSGQAEARQNHHRPGRQDRLSRPAHLLRAAGADAGAGAVEHQGQGRRDRHGAVQQQRRVHHLLRHAHRRRRRRLRLRPRGQPEEERAAHLELHRLRELHAAAGRAHQGRRGDEALRQHHGAVGSEGDEAEEGLQRARRAARDPLVAQGRATTGRSPPPR